jgi:hypothetical protein
MKKTARTRQPQPGEVKLRIVGRGELDVSHQSISVNRVFVATSL